MHFIEHIIEPTKLLLAWQSSDEVHRTRYVVGELTLVGLEVSLTYLTDTKDFLTAQSKGFDGYPAFRNIQITHHHVLDAFMRRLPPRTRGDFSQYLESLRLPPNAQLSDFALLGYSGAKLPTDGFSLIHPFDNVIGPCELLLEAAGFRHIQKSGDVSVKIDDPAFFSQEFNSAMQENAVAITTADKPIGYVNRALMPTFMDWMQDERIGQAWIEKINTIAGKTTLHLFVKIASKNPSKLS